MFRRRLRSLASYASLLNLAAVVITALCAIVLADETHLPVSVRATLIFVIAAGTTLLAAQRTSRRVQRDNKELERRIRERTFELQIAMQSALAASQTKTDFLANISHELRTPMNGIIGMLNMVGETRLDAEQRDQIETAQQCAYSLLALLNDMLDVSKIEAGRMTLELVPVNLSSLLSESLRMHSALARNKGIALGLDLPQDLPERVLADSLRLRQILNNLLANAIKFTEKGSVTLRAKADQASSPGSAAILLEVADTGIGIPENKLEAVFEKFTQADESISRRFGGTGLGLSISRSLAELHGGTIAVKSEVGKGSTFMVHLELALVAPAASTSDPQRSAEPHSRGSVLVVEDNPVNQKLTSAILRRQGYAVQIAGDGEQALACLEDGHFDVVLMDIQMPVLDGLETTRQLRQNPRHRHLPVIAMTACTLEGDRERCLAAGMDAFVPKPVHAALLLEIVAGQVEAHRAARQPEPV